MLTVPQNNLCNIINQITLIINTFINNGLYTKYYIYIKIKIYYLKPNYDKLRVTNKLKKKETTLKLKKIIL